MIMEFKKMTKIMDFEIQSWNSVLRYRYLKAMFACYMCIVIWFDVDRGKIRKNNGNTLEFLFKISL